MTYQANVIELAKALGVWKDSELHEEDVAVAQLIFSGSQGKVTIKGTPANRGGRLFLQDLAKHDKGCRVLKMKYDDTLRAEAAKFYAQLWQEHRPSGGECTLMDAIRMFDTVEYLWK